MGKTSLRLSSAAEFYSRWDGSWPNNACGTRCSIGIAAGTHLCCGLLLLRLAPALSTCKIPTTNHERSRCHAHISGTHDVIMTPYSHCCGAGYQKKSWCPEHLKRWPRKAGYATYCPGAILSSSHSQRSRFQKGHEAREIFDILPYRPGDKSSPRLIFGAVNL
jgi:hypothetical protein